MDIPKITEIATLLAEENGADIFLYNGAISRPYDDRVIKECRSTKRRNNVVLILCSYGGDPSAGYRIARCLQQKYTKFTVLIDGACKSAGTLMTVGAHEIVMSDQGEMGPLDIQVGKKDELWETDSGLTVLSAIKALEEKSFDLFESCFLNLKSRSGGRITLRTATEMASKLAIGTIAPIVAQIDPMHVGEVSRAMNIGMEYGSRLTKISKNAFDGTLQKLSTSYPSHGFVIDREEAKELFENVRIPTERECELLDLLAHVSKVPNQEQTFFLNLSYTLTEEANESNSEESNIEGSEISGEAVPRTEISSGKTESGTKTGGLRTISSKQKTTS